jgi:heme-degrading monooxygenase HmoA
MYARVSSITGSTENIDAGIDNFRNNALPAIRDEAGWSGAIMLVDRDTGKGMAITLWADEEAMRASEQRANELRAQAADALGAGEAPGVDRYEVAVFET